LKCLSGPLGTILSGRRRRSVKIETISVTLVRTGTKQHAVVSRWVEGYCWNPTVQVREFVRAPRGPAVEFGDRAAHDLQRAPKHEQPRHRYWGWQRVWTSFVGHQ